MLYFLKKLDKNNQKKEYYENLFKEEGKLVRKQLGSFCHKFEGAPLKDYYA